MAGSDENEAMLEGATLSAAPDGASDETLPMPGRRPAEGLQGTRVGRYVLGEPIGQGGMGVVFRARDPQLDRELAIKLVLPAPPRVASTS